MRFGGHESFYIRENWIAKGLYQVKKDPELFNDDFAEDYFGVGKNMLQSIIFWMRAARLVEKKYSKPLELTDFGKAVMTHDPYMVNPITWWLVHLNLMTHEDSLYIFPWLFNSQRAQEFTVEDLSKQANEYFKLHKKMNFSSVTLQKDLHCLINSYLPKETDKHPEDHYQCPLATLDLIRPSAKVGRFCINVEDRIFSAPMLAYSIWLYKNHEENQQEDTPLFKTNKIHEFRLDKIYEKESSPLRLLAISDEHFSNIIIKETAYEQKYLAMRNIAGHQNVVLIEMNEINLLNAIYQVR